MKSFFITVIAILLTALITGAGTYSVFAQRVARMDENKASKEEVQELRQNVGQLVEKLENSTQETKELKEAIKENTDKQQTADEKLRIDVAKNAIQQAAILGKLEVILKQLEKLPEGP